MFIIHPIIQCIGICIVAYVWWLGLKRFRMRHLGQKSRFNWKRHVRFGITGSINLLIGIAGGLFVVKSSWHGILITGIHGKMGLSLLPFIVFAIGSGIYMDRNKKKRTVLPLVHGIANTIILLIALSQIWSGILVYKTYVLGL